VGGMIKIRDNLTLKSCRVIAGIKAEEIAEAAGVSVDTLYKWEKGRSFPNAPQMVNIIKCFARNGYVVDLNDINFFNH
jgi:DNA-binding XRE family transcriptional regulator